MKKRLISTMMAIALLIGSILSAAEGGSWGRWFANLSGFTVSAGTATGGLYVFAGAESYSGMFASLVTAGVGGYGMNYFGKNLAQEPEKNKTAAKLVFGTLFLTAIRIAAKTQKGPAPKRHIHYD